MRNPFKFRLLGLNKYEEKLRVYNGYRKNSITNWRRQCRLPRKTVEKILKEFILLNGKDIRTLLLELVSDNSTIFNSHCSICSFGDPGKSGSLILYEFRHSCTHLSSNIIDIWKIPRLPSHSNIIFIDDMVGTGNQSVKYITTKLNSFLNPSHNAYLLSLFACPQGIDNIESNTNVQLKCAIKLNEDRYQHYSTKCMVFSESEKQEIIKINNSLKRTDELDYDLGLLIGFYNTIPNNTMPFIWKDGYHYNDYEGRTRKWFALLPRRY